MSLAFAEVSGPDDLSRRLRVAFPESRGSYPDRINPGALWTSARAVKPEPHRGETA